MLRNLLLVMVLSISFTSADGQRAVYNAEDSYEDIGVCELQNENQVLRLKLEVFKLKEEISELQKTLKSLNGDKDAQRVKAIKELKRQLRKGREVSLNIDYQ